MRRSVLAAALLAAAGCGASDPRCEPVCQALVSAPEEGGCGYTTWPDLGACVRGCSDEVYRRPDAGAILACYEEAAAACDDFALLRCRIASGPVPDAASF